MVKPARFDAPRRRERRRKRRRQSRWRTRWTALRWLVPAALLLLTANWWSGALAPFGDWGTLNTQFTPCDGSGAKACVIDGDTIMFGQQRVRLTGFDAPEMRGACPAETAKAQEARTALLRWLNRGGVELDGGADPPRDRHGRELRAARHVRSDGTSQSLADFMIEQGLARDTGWGADDVNWCA